MDLKKEIEYETIFTSIERKYNHSSLKKKVLFNLTSCNKFLYTR